jgi:linoleoyl-CoA desaturase
LGYHNRLSTDEKLLKRKLSYGEAKVKTLWTTLIITKSTFQSGLHCLSSGITWWKVLIGFFVMHYTAGLILSVVFQLARC